MDTGDESFSLEGSMGSTAVFQGHPIANAVTSDVDPDGMPRTTTLTLYRAADKAYRYISHAEYQYDERLGVLPGGQDWYQAYFRTFATAEQLVEWLRDIQSEQPSLAGYVRQAVDADSDVRHLYHG